MFGFVFISQPKSPTQYHLTQVDMLRLINVHTRPTSSEEKKRRRRRNTFLFYFQNVHRKFSTLSCLLISYIHFIQNQHQRIKLTHYVVSSCLFGNRFLWIWIDLVLMGELFLIFKLIHFFHRNVVYLIYSLQKLFHIHPIFFHRLVQK